MGIDLPAPAKHIRLTSHHPIDGVGCAPLVRWGAPDAEQRGPVIGSTTHRNQRNVIGSHSGSYGVYRALAVAAKSLTRGHRPDLTNTSPTDLIGPYAQGFDPARIVSLDLWGAAVADAYKAFLADGPDIRRSRAAS